MWGQGERWVEQVAAKLSRVSLQLAEHSHVSTCHFLLADRRFLLWVMWQGSESHQTAALHVTGQSHRDINACWCTRLQR